MKKLFVGVLAIASMVACMNEETVRVQDPAAIGFEANWVENATRANEAVDPSTTTESLTGFNVWGFMDSPAGKVFEAEDVTGSKGNFTYVNTAYWLPGHTYYFAALAPMDSANVTVDTTYANELGLGVVNFKNINGTEDLLYAANVEEAPALGESKTVKFTFSHLLSKVKFTFTNGFSNENMSIDVKNVRIVNAPAQANVVLNNKWWEANPWTDYLGTTTLAFGDACDKTGMGKTQVAANERLTIPASSEYEYKVEFEVALYMGDVEAYKGTKTSYVKGVALEMGKAYNFAATLNAENFTEEGVELKPIEFDVEEVKDWVTAETPDVNVQEAELRAALLLGGEVTLTEDLVITEPLVVAAGASSVINLNGKSIINETKTLDYGKGEGIVVYGDLVINGEGLVKGSTRAVWARGDKGATVTINGGTYEGCEDGYAEGGNSVIYASSGNVVNIYGGTVKALAADKTSYANKTEGVYAALNVADNNGMINVYGGSFYKQNPAAPGTEPAAWNAAHANGFVAEGYFVALVDDYYVVSDTQLVATAEEFAAALKADAETISVKLAGNLDVAISSLGTMTGGSGEYKLGGENTKNITIDLNGKKLNITTTYWSNLGAKNNDAVFTIKNGTMTSSQPTGTWNSYDLTFSNCNYVIEDVVFEKAIALAATGKSASLKNVTIKESHDYYAMWVRAAGLNVTADNLKIESAGRGIKIDEQYVGTPAKVTLNIANATFKTANKAAILVKSVAGAEINVENINIANVAKDTEFAVWVDEDSAAYADLVVVNGALVKVEGAKDTVASSATELAEAVQNGAKNVYLENGTYTLASYPAGLKLVGCGDNVVLDATGKKYGVNGNVAIENVEVRFSNDNYTGFQHTNVETYKKCTIVGQPFLYGNDVTFEGCTFEQTSADAYNVWTYGAKDVKFVNCVFNSAGKSVLIYTESGDGQDVLFEGCTLNASAPVEGKAAIEIDSSLIKGVFDITINDTTATGFANGNVSGNSLWNNKKGDKATITVDGVKVL